MGRKYPGFWKYICICIAGLILVSGCAAFNKFEKKRGVSRNLELGRKFLAERKFTEALEQNRNVLLNYGDTPPSDEALYNIGLIYIHYDNPDKDYIKALSTFKELIRKYPSSMFSEKARMFTGLLSDVELVRINSHKHLFKSRQKVADGDYEGALKEGLKALSANDKSPVMDMALFNMGLIYAHYANPAKNYNESALYFNRLVNEYKNSPLIEQAKTWLDLLYIIEKSKNIDIEIEKRKREIIR